MILDPHFLIYSIFAFVLTVISGTIPLLGVWKDDHLHSFVSFSAGILVSTAFLFLLPDALERVPANEAGIYILLSFVGLFILEKFIMLHPCEESHCNYHTVGITAYIGMFIHTFFDGVALGASLFVEGLGAVVFVAIMAHKVPSSFSLGSILRKANWPRSRVIIFLILFGLTIPLGALVSVNFLHTVTTKGVGIALALSLGTFMYISTSDFLPEVHRAGTQRTRNLICFLAGVGLLILFHFLLPEFH